MLGIESYLDGSQNNYDVDVEVADDRGRLHPATVPRFHDAYHARGVSLEAGVVDTPWAKKLTARFTAAGYDKELQHNIVMTVPYGEVHYGATLGAIQLRYEQPVLGNLDLELVGNYGHRSIDFVDESPWVYNWYGDRSRARRMAGEIEDQPSDQTIGQDGVFARAVLKWVPAPGHSVLLASAQEFASRTGDERVRGELVTNS